MTMTNEMKTILSNIAHSMIKLHAWNSFANCLSSLFICTIGKPIIIVQPIVWINSIFICLNGLPVCLTLSVLLICLNGQANCSSNLFTCLNGLPVHLKIFTHLFEWVTKLFE